MIAWLELTKPRVTLLVLVTAAAGFAAASGEGRALAWLLAGTALTAGGAAALNMVLERDTDARMERTRGRPLPSGRVAPGGALAFGAALAACGVAVLLVRVNGLAALIAGGTLLTYLAVYTPLKRVTPLATLVGALPGAAPPVMGWAAARGSLDEGALAVFVLLYVWQLPHCAALASMYRADYERAGFPVVGEAQARRLVVVGTAGLVGASLLPAWAGVAGFAYVAVALLLGAGPVLLALAFAATPSRASAVRLLGAGTAYLPLVLAAAIVL